MRVRLSGIKKKSKPVRFSRLCVEHSLKNVCTKFHRDTSSRLDINLNLRNYSKMLSYVIEYIP